MSPGCFASHVQPRETFRRVWKEKVVSCGKAALRRFTPSRSAQFAVPCNCWRLHTLRNHCSSSSSRPQQPQNHRGPLQRALGRKTHNDPSSSLSSSSTADKDDSQSEQDLYEHLHGSDSQPNDDWMNELAPVHDKWATSTGHNDKDDIQPHVLALPLLRKLVLAGGLLQSSDNDCDHHKAPTKHAESYRALAWRVFLGYLPLNTQDWTETLEARRTWYRQAMAKLVHDTLDVRERAPELLVPCTKHRQRNSPLRCTQSDHAAASFSSSGSSAALRATQSQPPLAPPPPIPAALRTYWCQQQGLDGNILEFLFPDTIRLWDSMFASTHKDNVLRYVCVTMIMTMRDKLLKGDFGACLRLLHSYPSTSIERLLEASRALWVYESQISVECHRGGLSLSQALQAIASPPALIMAYGFPNGTQPPMSSSSKRKGRFPPRFDQDETR
jgi:hypothetical protein